jgi:tRNA-dependent cyclodipeptide synthase
MRRFVLGRDGDKDAQICLAACKAFVPISLGNHYYSSKMLQRIMRDLLAGTEHSIIFLCDRLRLLSYMIRGEEDADLINSNIQIQLQQMSRALLNSGLGSYPNITVANWSFLQDDSRYHELLASLESFVKASPAVSQQLDRYAAHFALRFGAPHEDDPKRRVQFQWQYIIEETALSIYMTEIRDHSVEIYRRGMGFVDYLYAGHAEALRSWTGKKTLNRKFVSIEQWVQRKGGDETIAPDLAATDC